MNGKKFHYIKIKDEPKKKRDPRKKQRVMKNRRGTDKPENLCSGPGKLCSALGITREQSGADLCKNELFILDMPELPKSEIIVSPRINIDYAEEYRDKLWRYFVKGNKFVSKVPKKYVSQDFSGWLAENAKFHTIFNKKVLTFAKICGIIIISMIFNSILGDLYEW